MAEQELTDEDEEDELDKRVTEMRNSVFQAPHVRATKDTFTDESIDRHNFPEDDR